MEREEEDNMRVTAGKSIVPDASKRLLAGILAALVCLLLSACTGEQYREDEAKQLLESGTQKMQSCLAENGPGAEITGTGNHIDYYPSGPRYLSDYVAGKFRSDEGGEQDFLINAVTGEVYFGLTEENETEFRDACVSCVAERFGFGNGYETYAGTEGFAWLVLPTLAPGTERRVGHDSFAYAGLPAETVLSGKRLEEFVREPEGRPLIGLHHWYYLPEGMDLSGIRLEKARQMRDEYGILPDNVVVYASGQDLEIYSRSLDYARSSYGDLGPFRIRFTSFSRRENSDSDDGEILVEEREHVPGTDVTVTPTEHGYRFDFPTVGWFEPYLYAEDGSEVLGKDYLFNYDTEDKNSEDWPVRWVRMDSGAEEGLWRLCYEDDGKGVLLGNRSTLTEAE